ncbi:MAG: 4-hydroxy-tetrahydrodipicolinate reductase [Thermoleophilia bacterium]|nr:4-hydroxy-tetrahydrodipicolinate reductase [Thermoleophilia bacterium]
MINVLVAGAAGRMGSTVVDAVTEAEGMRVAARVDPALEAGDDAFADVPAALAAGGVDVAVDFTQPHVVFPNVLAYLEAGVHAVVGTTGLTDDQVDEIRRATGAGRANALIAPNFAVGAVLMMRFAAEASRFMEKAEIIELHHDKKLDAPSGTALRTASLMHGEPIVHSVRLPGLVAHQEVLLGGTGETLSIRHDSIDRVSFMPGVVRAVRQVGDRPGLTLGLEEYLFG